MTISNETVVLVLQGGGALGAYQAGAIDGLDGHGYSPDWVAGISIGAINAAIIAGNPPDRRLDHLRSFWEGCSSAFASPFSFWGSDRTAAMVAETAAATVAMTGVGGFFRPRWPSPTFRIPGSEGSDSWYDTAPLRQTLLDLVDFDYLNDHGPRLSLGAVDVETGNFAYFDSDAIRITPEHVMASGALPPGFPSVEIGGRRYWDGGLVSNTPLQYVLESHGTDPLCVFQVDLFSAQGVLPLDLASVGQRLKDIQYSSRTRLTTDRFRELDDLGTAARRLRAKLPETLRDDPDLHRLCDAGPGRPVTLVHLIHRQMDFEGAAKDYEFSRVSMLKHWAEGCDDVAATLALPGWAGRKLPEHGIEVYDQGETACPTSLEDMDVPV